MGISLAKICKRDKEQQMGMEHLPIALAGKGFPMMESADECNVIYTVQFNWLWGSWQHASLPTCTHAN